MIDPTVPSLTVELVPIDSLHPDPANPRRIADDELESLTRSLRQWGFVQPVLARREDSVVIGGHQRLVAARRVGLTEVPVIWLDISQRAGASIVWTPPVRPFFEKQQEYPQGDSNP